MVTDEDFQVNRDVKGKGKEVPRNPTSTMGERPPRQSATGFAIPTGDSVLGNARINYLPRPPQLNDFDRPRDSYYGKPGDVEDDEFFQRRPGQLNSENRNSSFFGQENSHGISQMRQNYMDGDNQQEIVDSTQNGPTIASLMNSSGPIPNELPPQPSFQQRSSISNRSSQYNNPSPRPDTRPSSFYFDADGSTSAQELGQFPQGATGQRNNFSLRGSPNAGQPNLERRSLQNLRQHNPTQSAPYFPRPIEGELPPLPSAAQLLDHSHLKPGARVKLLNYDTTLEQYRENAKKTNDPNLIFEFACFVMEVVRELDPSKPREAQKREALILESTALLGRIANRGHVLAQYLLADLYSQGIGTAKGKRDYGKAFPLFVLAAKHGHGAGAFRAGQCLENGWGCRKDFAKSVQFYRKAAALSHPSAMYRLGLAELNGELGLSKKPKEGVKWLKRAAELADSIDPPQPQPLHELALLHERGIDNVVLVDFDYAAELLARAAELNWAPSAYKLGECYEYGKMDCPQDPALSIHYYNIAAQQDHAEACFALTAWYLVGSPGVLPQSDTEAYLWAKKAAEKRLPKAEYAVGYFSEVGIGTTKDRNEALLWFRRAASHGDKRAIQRLKSQFPSDSNQQMGNENVDRAKMLSDRKESLKKGKKGKDDSDCVIC